MTLRIDDLPAERIRSLLVADVSDLADEEAVAVEDFIERIGGRANALAAVEMLDRLEGHGRRLLR